jgi:osmotically-inducible protein OsmY
MMKTVPLRVALLATVLSSVTMLEACVPLAIAGVGAGVLMATDRRSTGTIAVDNEIDFKGSSALRSALAEKAHVNVTAYNRIVLLTGEVASEADKKMAEDTINRIINVRSVVNELQVAPNSSITARSNDLFLQGKIKASFVDAKDIFSNSFKVVVENGTAYLMGIVTEREGTSAADIASRVKGVNRVVKVLEFASEEELRRMGDPANAKPPAPVETKPAS